MIERTTKAIIIHPTLTREQLQNKMGCPPKKADFFTISFNGRVFTNRCPPELTEKIVATIKPNCLEKWRFQNRGGLLYKTSLSKLAVKLKLTEIIIDPKKIPKWIKVTSPHDEYMAHDKRFSIFQQRLNRNGVLIVALQCNENTDQCKCPKIDFQLRSMRYRTEQIKNISQNIKKEELMRNV